LPRHQALPSFSNSSMPTTKRKTTMMMTDTDSG
jgi:hypothetical protein